MLRLLFKMNVDSTGRCVTATQEVKDNSSAEVLEHLTETLNNYHQNLEIATQQVLRDTQSNTYSDIHNPIFIQIHMFSLLKLTSRITGVCVCVCVCLCVCLRSRISFVLQRKSMRSTKPSEPSSQTRDSTTRL